MDHLACHFGKSRSPDFSGSYNLSIRLAVKMDSGLLHGCGLEFRVILVFAFNERFFIRFFKSKKYV